MKHSLVSHLRERILNAVLKGWCSKSWWQPPEKVLFVKSVCFTFKSGSSPKFTFIPVKVNQLTRRIYFYNKPSVFPFPCRYKYSKLPTCLNSCTSSFNAYTVSTRLLKWKKKKDDFTTVFRNTCLNLLLDKTVKWNAFKKKKTNPQLTADFKLYWKHFLLSQSIFSKARTC